MKTVRLLQIGDVHFPDSRDGFSVDVKDKAFPTTLMHAAVSNALQNAVRQVLDVCQQYPVQGLLFCGDLTSRGDLSAYRSCLDYLIESLDINDSRRWHPNALHVVPGNHDIDRRLSDPNGGELFGKFAPLRAAWDNIPLPVLATDSVRSTCVSKDDCAVQIFSINSCIGCGERRSLPQPIQEDLKNLLDAYAGVPPTADAFSLVGEQLDTPAFHEEHVTELVQSIQSLPNTHLPVVVAHHNLLPQALVRIDIYTEVINGGLVRSRLSSCPRPVVYCHGHIHRDPVEVIRDARVPDGRLISISAPEFINGFNIVQVAFSRSRIPLGCEIIEYRRQEHGGITQRPSIRIPLVTPRDTRRLEAGNDLLRPVLQVMARDPLRFATILDAVRHASGRRHHEHTVADAIIEAEWLGLTEVDNRNAEPSHWTIRKADA